MNDLATLSQEVTITNEQTELIRNTVCKDATNDEMKLFFFDCQRRGVHPLDKLIHFTKRKCKYTPITSIDFFRVRAHSSGVYAGEEPIHYEIGTDGLPDSCTFGVLRIVQGNLCPWRATARWDEYYPGEDMGFMWKKMPFLMLAKCAEALALRKAFPAELQGLYVKEEMDQAGPETTPLKASTAVLEEQKIAAVQAALTKKKTTVQGDGLVGSAPYRSMTTGETPKHQAEQDAPAPSPAPQVGSVDAQWLSNVMDAEDFLRGSVQGKNSLRSIRAGFKLDEGAYPMLPDDQRDYLVDLNRTVERMQKNS